MACGRLPCRNHETILANPRLAAAVSAELQEVEAKLANGRTVKGALAVPGG